MKNAPLSYGQRGLSLVSLMIALTIAMFLMAGLFGIWLQTRNTFGDQGDLAQIQVAERMAVTIVANTVRTGGYYPEYANYSTTPPSPLYTSTGVFTVVAPFTVAGQFVYGTYSASAPGDSLTVRFMADANTLDCLGQTPTANTLVVNTFSVTTDGDLQCSVNGGTAETIVSGVSRMNILYGVDISEGNEATYQYLTATQVAAGGYWKYVKSVDLQLIFTNPLSGTGQPATLPVVDRIIAVLQTTS